MSNKELDRLMRGVPRPEPFKDLGRSKLARQIDPHCKTLAGKWCSRCRGIWFGLPGECECPKCGNRHG